MWDIVEYLVSLPDTGFTIQITNLSCCCKSGWRAALLQLKSSSYIHAAFLIDATGRTTALYAGLPRLFHVVDRLIGVVRFLTRVAAEPYALVEAVAHGWWYSAPVSQDRFVVALMTDADLVARSGCSPYVYWIHQLAVASLTSARAGEQFSLAESKIVSAASVLRNSIYGTDWLAAGDASVAFDPLSGQESIMR